MSRSAGPAVTVIVPASGRVALFRETLACLATQTSRRFDVIVPDDSLHADDRDEIIAAASRFESTSGISTQYVFTRPQLYQATNTNQGLERVSAPYARILHSDDLLRRDAIETELQILESNGWPRFLFHDVVPFQREFKSTNPVFHRFVDPWHFIRTYMSSGTPLPSGAVFATSLLREAGPMRDDYRFLCDWDLFFRMLLSEAEGHRPVIRITPGLVGWRVHEESVTSRLWLKHFEEHAEFTKRLCEAGTAPRLPFTTTQECDHFLVRCISYRYQRLMQDFSRLALAKKIRHIPRILASIGDRDAIRRAGLARLLRTGRHLFRPAAVSSENDCSTPRIRPLYGESSFVIAPHYDDAILANAAEAYVSDYNNALSLWQVRQHLLTASTTFLYYPNTNRFYIRTLKEVLKYIGEGNQVVLVLSDNDHLTWFGAKAVVEELFPGEFQVDCQSQSGAAHHRITFTRVRPVMGHYSETHTGWTFGLLTLGDRQRNVIDFISSLTNSCTAPYEVVVVCPERLSFLDGLANVRQLHFKDKDKVGWITKKKNLICESARYSDILVCHDRFSCASDFFTQFELWGYSYGIAAPRVRLADGRRGLDWAVVSSSNSTWSSGGLLNYRAYSRFAYVPGGATLVRKAFWRRYQWNENLYWNEHEDVELCRRAQRGGEVIWLANSTLIAHADRWVEQNPVIPYDDTNEVLFGAAVGEQRVRRLNT